MRRVGAVCLAVGASCAPGYEAARTGTTITEYSAAESAASDEASLAGVPAGSPRPALTPALQRLRRLAQQRVLGREADRGLPSLAYEAEGAPQDPRAPSFGQFVPMEPESALTRFHAALARLADGTDEDGKVRILAYGASHTQADAYTGYLRAYLQSRFGDGGQGFVLLGRVNKWYRTLDTAVHHKRVRMHHAHFREGVQEEPLGLLGAALVGRYGDGFGEIITAKDSPNTEFEVHYYTHPRGGDFTLQVDGKSVARIRTRSKDAAPAYYAFRTTAGRHSIRARLHGKGVVRLFGITAETARPGVVVDTLGISGARLASSLRWQEEAWVDALRRRTPDLVTFAYGTNELMDPEHGAAAYERQLRAVLTRLRKALPDVSCAFIAPFDVPKREGAKWVGRPRLLQIIETQQRVSQEFGCAFWNGYAFVGGGGALHGWAIVDPPLASRDHVHLTRRGYVYAGTAVGDALMRAYDAALAQPSGAVAAAPSAASR
jgi:lysophospholipase L1-like esterase